MKQEARLKKWDELIRQKRYPGIQNFCALLGVEGAVSDRTLEADIRELKKILASKYTSLDPSQLLKFSRSRGGYYYPESISAFTEIDSRDIRNLQELSRSLSGFTHLFVTNEAKNAFYKLKAIAKLEESKKQQDALWNPVIYTKEGARDGQDYFDEIIHSIEDLCAITLQYRAFGKKQLKKHLVLPLVIKEWQNAWYLLACPLPDPEIKRLRLKKDELQLFALNRIQHISRESISLRPKIVNLGEFNPATYFQNSFGVFRENLSISENQPEILKLMLDTADAWMYDYIKRTPIHPTVHILSDDPEKNYLRFTMDLEWSPELEAFLLQFSPMLKLKGTVKAVKKFRERLKRIQDSYSDLN
jgi:predicted DNA-binding transcriptional regulator YafY